MLQTIHICSLCRRIGQYISQWINPRSFVSHCNSFIKSFPCTLLCVLVFIFTTFAFLNRTLYQLYYVGWVFDIISRLLSVIFTAIFFTVIWIFLELIKIFIERKTSVVLPEIDPDGFLVENIDSSGDQANLGQPVKITTRRLALTDEDQRFELQRYHLQVKRQIPLGLMFSESLRSNRIYPFPTALQSQLNSLNTLTNAKTRDQRCSKENRLAPPNVSTRAHSPKEIYHKASLCSSRDDNSSSSYLRNCSHTQASSIPRTKFFGRCNLTRKMSLHKHGDDLSQNLSFFPQKRKKMLKTKTMEPEFKKESTYEQYNASLSEDNSENTDTASEEESELRTLREKNKTFKACAHAAKQHMTPRVSTSVEFDLSVNTLASQTKPGNNISTHFDAKNLYFTSDPSHQVFCTSNEVIPIASTSNKDSLIASTSRNHMVDAITRISSVSGSRKPFSITPKEDLMSSLCRETLSEESISMKIIPIDHTVKKYSPVTSTSKEENFTASSMEVTPIDSRSKQNSLITSTLREEQTTASGPVGITSISFMSNDNPVSSTSRQDNAISSVSIGNCSEGSIENLKRLLTIEFDDLNSKSQNLNTNNLPRDSKDFTEGDSKKMLKRKRRSKSAPPESCSPPIKIPRFMEGKIKEN